MLLSQNDKNAAIASIGSWAALAAEYFIEPTRDNTGTVTNPDDQQKLRARLLDTIFYGRLIFPPRFLLAYAQKYGRSGAKHQLG